MGGLSLWHWIIVLLVVLILFGRGRISDIMGDFGKGIKSFKEGINDESKDHASPTSPAAPPPPAQIAPQPPVQPVATIVDPATGVPVPEPGMTHLSNENKTGA
ncbi:sec-independent protein translocase protein TatA [Novosphingobium chloroacetimidivorans]|uniref:Sec-independent protein translocase protein TatA n=1 Tax=Novosphingobium chloroacetimidivorans TaxID=1428314 RepID=A0A7W7NVU5_9SPHN|nr:twin-arginine translocase TatA/TatE family subunit [Novosphingobium chloroacetimidivorans]MBB4857465.1 sec-independent protein translocase protein TatA [Novosphingobium chloroacetimidivorans]